MLVIFTACNKSNNDIDKQINNFDTQHKPLVYLIDYIKENGNTIISWKYNARYELIKSLHLKNSAGDEIAEIDFPVDYYVLDGSYAEKEIILQVENKDGKFHEENILNLDKDQEYEQLLEKEPIKRVMIDKSAAMPFFH